MTAKTKKKRSYTAPMIVLVTAILLYSTFSTEDPASIWQTISHSNLLWLGLAGVFYLLFWLGDAISLHLMVGQIAGTKIKFIESMRVAIVGTLFSCLTPSATGGQPMQIIRLRKSGVSVGKSTAIFTIRFITYQLTIILMTAFLMIFRYRYFAGRVTNLQFLAIIGFVVCLLSVLALIVASIFPKFTKKIISGLVKLLAGLRLIRHPKKMLVRINYVIDDFSNWPTIVAKNKRILWQQCLISFVQMAFYFMIGLFVFRAISPEKVDLTLVMTAAAMVWMSSAFVPLPGGSGGAESSFLLFFGAVYHHSPLGAALLAWRSVTFYLPIVVGSAMLFAESRKKQASFWQRLLHRTSISEK